MNCTFQKLCCVYPCHFSKKIPRVAHRLNKCLNHWINASTFHHSLPVLTFLKAGCHIKKEMGLLERQGLRSDGQSQLWNKNCRCCCPSPCTIHGIVIQYTFLCLSACGYTMGVTQCHYLYLSSPSNMHSESDPSECQYLIIMGNRKTLGGKSQSRTCCVNSGSDTSLISTASLLIKTGVCFFLPHFLSNLIWPVLTYHPALRYHMTVTNQGEGGLTQASSEIHEASQPHLFKLLLLMLHQRLV